MEASVQGVQKLTLAAAGAVLALAGAVAVPAQVPAKEDSATPLKAKIAIANSPGIRALAAPSNDLWGGAITVAIPSSTAGTTVEATADGAASCGGTVDSPGVWYHLVGDGATITASLCGPASFDTKLSVYTDAGATCVAGNDDFCGLQSEVTWSSTAGIDYYVLVHGYSGATGTFTLGLSSRMPPVNDACASAVTIDAVPFVHEADTRLATTAIADPVMGCETGQNSNTVWFVYTPFADGLLTVSTIGSNYDTVLAVFTGGCGSLAAVACNDDSSSALQSLIADLPVVAHTTYYIEVADFGAPNGGTLHLSLDCPAVPVELVRFGIQ